MIRVLNTTGRSKRTWNDGVEADMRNVKIKKEETLWSAINGGLEVLEDSDEGMG